MGDSIRVLLVRGDGPTEPDIAAGLEAESERIVVECVETIEDGLNRLERDGADCVLCEGDCLELIERIREQWPSLPVFLYGSSGSVVEAAFDAGATGYVPTVGQAETGLLAGVRIETAVERYREEQQIGTTPTDFGPADPERTDAGPAWIFDQLFRHVPTHLYVKDAEGRYLYVSDHHVDDPEAQVGLTDREIYPDPIGREAHEDDRRVIETGEPILEKEEYAAFQNEWNLTSKVPWYDRTGEVAGLVGVTRRITERKAYEKRLERQNERLEEFVESVSHDLRNPLTVAQGRLELVREECESDHFEAIEQAHQRMETLVEEVLTLADEGDIDTSVEPVGLCATVRRCWESVATHEAALAVETDATILADERQLRQLLENLIRNAIEHGGSDVTVTVGDCADGFYVADDGVGIPPDERDRVFDRGYSSAGEGTGFGLSIVAQIAERNDWDVRVAESEGGGARFEVTSVEFAD